MGFPKIDKGTLITIFFFDFQILGIKTSMLTNFQVHQTIFTELTRHSMIGSPERVKIQRSSIPKLGIFIAAFGSYMSKTFLGM